MYVYYCGLDQYPQNLYVENMVPQVGAIGRWGLVGGH
jgi:hypothetical protein